jgi:hypothetical protein
MTLRAMLVTLVLTVVAALGGSVLIASTASAEVCPTGWGSTPKSSLTMNNGLAGAPRVGSHPCYDRIVWDVAAPAAGYDVRYVSTVYAEGSGLPLYVPGGARLQVVLRHPTGSVPYTVNQRAANVAGFPVLRSVTYGGWFEGYTTYGVGVRARLPFRVSVLPGTTPGTSRIVLDVARQW